MRDYPQWRWMPGLEADTVAIILDERARAAIARRRGRGKDARIVLRIAHGSLHVGVPWTLAVGWPPRHWSHDTLVEQRAGDVEIYVHQRIARYSQSRDLTVSSARVGPWEWLVVADPFAFEHMQQWERTQSDDQEQAAVSPAAARAVTR